MENTYMILGGIALFVILIAIIVGKNVSANLSKKGFQINKKEGKDNISVSDIKNKSNIELNSQKNQNVIVNNVDNSSVKINKNSGK